MLSFLVLGYYVTRSKGITNLSDKIVRIIICLMAFVFGVCSFRLFVILFFPLFAVHCILKLWTKEPLSLKNDPIFYEIIIWLALSLLGTLVTLKLIMPLGFGPVEYQSKSTLGLVYIFTKILPTFLTEFFKANPIFYFMTEANLFSLSAINGLLCLVFFVLVIYLIKVSYKNKVGLKNNIYNILLFSLAITVISQFMFMFKSVVQFRYYLLIFVLFSLVYAYSFEELCKTNIVLKKIMLCGLTIFFATNSIYNIKQLDYIKDLNISRVSDWHAEEISNILQKHGVNLGYALYWDSNTITVLTNGKTEIAAVYGNMTPMGYVTPYRYYSPELADTKSAFIRISQPVFDWNKGLPLFEISKPEIFDNAVAKETIKGPFYDIDIFIFDRNYFTFPEGHDPKKDYVPVSEQDMLPFMTE
jgi:hypothetical protein